MGIKISLFVCFFEGFLFSKPWLSVGRFCILKIHNIHSVSVKQKEVTQVRPARMLWERKNGAAVSESGMFISCEIITH
jgi:hypothetical protein